MREDIPSSSSVEMSFLDKMSRPDSSCPKIALAASRIRSLLSLLNQHEKPA